MQDSTKGTSGVYVLAHPVRRAIVEVLKKKEAYTSQIARELDLSEKLISFHLSILSTTGLVESRYGLSNPTKNPPRAVRYYRITPKVAEVLKEFVESLK